MEILVSRRLLILGAGGHGKVVADYATQLKQFSNIGFLDSGFPEKTALEQWTVYGHTDELSQFVDHDTQFFVAIGNNQIRKRFMLRLKQLDAKIANIVHPSAVISPITDIGIGCLVCANVVINACSRIGDGCIVNTSASVDHDCYIGDFVHLAPGTRLAGNITVGDESFVGIGSTVIQNVEIGMNCIVGAGSTVLSAVADNTTVVGSPAKQIKEK